MATGMARMKSKINNHLQADIPPLPSIPANSAACRYPLNIWPRTPDTTKSEDLLPSSDFLCTRGLALHLEGREDIFRRLQKLFWGLWATELEGSFQHTCTKNQEYNGDQDPRPIQTNQWRIGGHKTPLLYCIYTRREQIPTRSSNRMESSTVAELWWSSCSLLDHQ